MIILSLKTDQEQAHLGLFDNQQRIDTRDWLAGRQLAEKLHDTLQHMLSEHSLQLTDIEALVVYAGPGSFTGLRIGLTTANTIAYALSIPMSGTTGDDWEKAGIANILQGDSTAQVMPEYGAPVHITLPKK